MEAHGVEKTSLHYLPTPTDSYVLTEVCPYTPNPEP